MKAVIMAGGKGTRLCPLTSLIPKPMVPLLGRPCMEYIIELLKRHGIREIAVTLQYLPQVIMNQYGDGSEFGVKLTYFEEISPLGTAGSVKNAEEFLDETFIVISGDALTDFDLSRAVDFHREKKSLGTLVLTQVNVPLDYGVVMTGEEGKIISFFEKPSWSEVFSDTVNTGIYVLEPEILTLIPKEKQFDFAKDLFPLVMNRGQDLYGYVAEGYWSDIGNLSQYRQTQFDMLKGDVKLSIKGLEVSPGVWFERETKIPAGVNIKAPVYIGEGTTIEPGAVIGPNTILGQYNRLADGVCTEQTVMWNRNYVGRAVNLSGATLCNGIRIGAGSHVYENVVIGEKTFIKNSVVIMPGVKIWPEKIIEAGTVQSSSIIWGKSVANSLFSIEGIKGIPNLDLTPEFIGKVAAAYGSRLRTGATVCVSCDDYAYNYILKYTVISSLLAIGVKVRDIGTTVTPIARYECRNSQSDGGIHIWQGESEREKIVCVQFFDKEGLPIDKGLERKIENAFLQEDFARPNTSKLGLLEQMPVTDELYLEEILSRVDLNMICDRGFRVALQCKNPLVISILTKLLGYLDCEVIVIQNVESPFSKGVIDNMADLGVELDSSGQYMRLVTNRGKVLSDTETLVLKTLASLRSRTPIAIPVTAPTILGEIMEEAGVPVVWTKTISRSLLEVGKIDSLQVHYDSFYSLVSIIEHLAKADLNLQSLLDQFPEFYISMKDVICPSEAKGRVMRRLMEEIKGQNIELIDGIKVRFDDSWALILPDSEKALFKVVAQGITRSGAEELSEKYQNKIISYRQG